MGRDQPRTLREFAEGLEEGRRYRLFGASQRVWSKLEKVAHQAALLYDLQQDEKAKPIFDRCLSQLRKARWALDGGFFRRSFVFWEAVHEVDELLILVTPDDMLAGAALGVLTLFKNNIKDCEVRKEWLGGDERSSPLVKAFERATRNHRPSQVGGEGDCDDGGGGATSARAKDKAILKDALHAVNDHTDTTFFYMCTRTSFRLWGAALLAALLAVAAGWGVRAAAAWGVGGAAARGVNAAAACGVSDEAVAVCWRQLTALAALLGAMGALAASMTKPLVFATGATTRFFLHGLVGKPVVGAFAAVVVLLVEQSGLLFKVVAADHGASDAASTLVKITVDTQLRAVLARAVIALLAGYSGERLLTSVFDQLQQKLFAAGEKTAKGVEENGRS